MNVGGIRGPVQTPQTQQTAPTQQTQQTQQTQSVKQNKEAFASAKAETKLPTTNVNALTQLNSQDQKLLMKMSQEKTIGKLSENLKNAKKQLETDVLPRSIIGAGQSVPPASMRAMAGMRGSLFSGRQFEVMIGVETSTLSFRIGGKSFNVTVNTKLKKSATKKAENQEENLEEDLEEDL